MIEDFCAVIAIKHEEAMKSRLPAAFHKILGRRVIDYMLINLAEMSPKEIFVLMDEEYFHHMDKSPVKVICKRLGTDVDDIKKEYGGDVEFVVFEEVRIETTIIADRQSLVDATFCLMSDVNQGHMCNGVTIANPANTYIGPDAKIGIDTIIYPGAIIEGDTTIGENCIIGQNCRLVNMTIGDGVEMWHTVALDSEIDDNSIIGPFAYLRPGSKIGKNVKIGDFVEVKNSVVGDGSKASHLSYIGDATIGENVNIGCGAITVNYDGVTKQRTVVEDGAFIGCSTNLIAPVTVGKGAYTAAGSTINKDVPSDALGIARCRQENKENWATKRKGK